MQRWLKIFFLPLFLFIHSGLQQAMAVEPAMADYTHYPIFQLNAVEPNILIILDNSGSMNFNAYGTWPGNGGIVTDAPFLGEPYRGVVSNTVSQASDDAEQTGNYTYDDSNDLDFSSYYTVGIRFGGLSIPHGALILSAQITFKCSAPMNGSNAAATTVTFHGQASDNASTFGMDTYDNNISSRPSTTASVPWEITTPWTTGLTYQSPDLSPIVQEIVNRGGWKSGNAIAFKVSSTQGYRAAEPVSSASYGSGV